MGFQQNVGDGFCFVEVLHTYSLLFNLHQWKSVAFCYSYRGIEQNVKIRQKEVGGYLSGFTISNLENNLLMIPCILFAKDTLIFCGANSNKVLHLRYVFTWFKVVSGIKLNLGKSWLVPVGNVHDLEELVTILGCKMSKLPMEYLTLPFDFKFKAKIIWITILEIWKKDRWNGNDSDLMKIYSKIFMEGFR